MVFSQWPKSHRIFKRQAKALIRLRVCAGWSEPLLIAHTTLFEISCRGSYAQKPPLNALADVFSRYRICPESTPALHSYFTNASSNDLSEP